MKTIINIECEDKRELIMHLEVIKEELEQLVDTDVIDGLELEDSNCYGTHTLIVKE
jgi:hypothetical protein